ncbi:MAG: hypothetical protein SXV54_09670 [Chloroflexota bacterium]|nr:hypothetical protein [Chloroflexota bacterium]
MPEWQVKNINLRIEYAVQAEDAEDVYDPYETVIEFPIEMPVEVVDHPGDLSGQDIILGLIRGGMQYALYRFDDEVRLNFETDGDDHDDDGGIQQKLLRGALKISVTSFDPAASETVVDTANYPIGRPKDRVNVPDGLNWELLLKREDTKYRLIYVYPVGAGVQPICKRLKCRTTRNPRRRLRCALIGCYF